MMLGLYFISGIFLAAMTMLVRKRSVAYTSLILFLFVQTLLTAHAFMHRGEKVLTYFCFDNTGLLFLALLTVLSYFTAYYSFIYLKRNRDNVFRTAIYCTALIMLLVSVTGVYLSEHAGLMWVFVEATTLCVSLLIYHERSTLSLEATWKYVFICSIGVALAFVGIIFLGMAVQSNGVYDLSFSAILAQASTANPFWMKMVFLFILVGFSTKMGLFPLQAIKVDALNVAPSPVGAFISTILMNAGFLALYRFYHALSPGSTGEWMNNLLMWTGMLSILIATIYMLFVGNLKRMGAYSGLEHIGLIAVGLSLGGPVLYAVFLHLILHTFIKSGFFFHLGAVFNHFRTYKINGIKDYFGKAPLAALVFFMLILFLGAIPPSGLFVSEFLIFKGLFNASHFWEMFLLLILLTIIIFAFIRNALNIVFAEDTSATETYGKIRLIELLPILLLLVSVIWLAYFPPKVFVDFLTQCTML
jgi:hydrogenase-4 component F